MAMKQTFASRFVVGSLGVLTMSTVVAATALARALVLDPLPAVKKEPTLRYATLQGSTSMAVNVLEDAAAEAPFSPTRQAAITPAPVAAARDEISAIQLVGTVVSAGSETGGFVLVTVNGQAAKMIRVGETVAGHRLHSIAQASAVFIRNVDGARVELRVPRSR